VEHPKCTSASTRTCRPGEWSTTSGRPVSTRRPDPTPRPLFPSDTLDLKICFDIENFLLFYFSFVFFDLFLFVFLFISFCFSFVFRKIFSFYFFCFFQKKLAPKIAIYFFLTRILANFFFNLRKNDFCFNLDKQKFSPELCLKERQTCHLTVFSHKSR